MSNFIQTDSARTWVKTMLMIFNLAFWASGLALMFEAIWMQLELKRYLELSVDFSASFSNTLLAIGIGILVVATLACFFTYKNQTSLLYLYGALLAVILILEVVVALSIFSYKNRLVQSLNLSLNQSMQSYGPDNVQSQDFDTMQAEFKCCGIKGPLDWERKASPVPIPVSCCLDPMNCDVQDEADVFPLGCYTKVLYFLNHNMARVGTIAFFISLFPLLSAVLACVLASGLNKIRYEQVT